MADREFFLLDMRYKPEVTPGACCDECGHHIDGPPPLVKHGAELMVWWGPNNSGYGNSLVSPWVGRYGESRLREGASYYQLGTLTLAIPCEAVLPFALPRPDRFLGQLGSSWCDGPGPVVINHSLLWDLLEPLAWTPEALHV